MAYKAPKPTKAQLAEAKVRAAASGISMNQSAKGLRNASKAIVAGASMLPAGRAVKAASTAVKATSTYKKASLAKAAKKYDNALIKGTPKRLAAEAEKNKFKIEDSVKVKPAAKQKPNPPDMAKISDKYQNRSYRTLDDPALSRKEKIQIKKLVSNRPSTQPSAFGSVNGRIKINSNPVKPKPAPKKK
jgi:hypothetical protein